MSLIKIENLTFSYPSGYENIFENVSLQIDTNWKLALVGRNGRGKTTLFRLLMGDFEYSGKIISNTEFEYFPYRVKNKSKVTEDILSDICPAAQEWEIMRELAYLEVDADILWRKFDTLSNGEQTKVLLAALFLNECRFLLIDEPTNHLDEQARRIVSQYLNRKKGFIVISHDRQFLDECTDHILSINKCNIEVQSGNFTSWFNNFNQQQKSEADKSVKLQKEIKQLKRAAAQTKNWSNKVEASKKGAVDKGYVGHKAAKMMQRSKNLQTRQNQAIEEKSSLLNNAEIARSLKLTPIEYHSRTLVNFSNVSIYYNDKTVCKPVSFTIEQGDSVFIDGINGSGKSSILKLIAGEKISHSGNVSIGSGLKISYVPQSTSNLKGRLSDFIFDSQIDESQFKTILNKMNFDKNLYGKDLSELSEGQKKIVMLAKSLCEKAHLYIWDEPLNYIDIYTRIQIENLICEYAPTIIMVEHDSMFRNKTANKTISIEKHQ